MIPTLSLPWDERVYLTKLYGNGRPLDGNSFKRVDISGLKPTYPIFRGTPYLDARLASLTVNAGVAAIDPAFNGDTHYYEADVAAASGAIAAVAADAVNATVTMTLNGSTVSNPASITFAEGQNVVVITVTNGTETRPYVGGANTATMEGQNGKTFLSIKRRESLRFDG